MKKTFAVFFAALLCIFALSASAADEYCLLNDNAELLTDGEYKDILAYLDEVSKRQKMDIAILTVDDLEYGFTVEQDATEQYEKLGYGEDGVMLYVNMGHNEMYILTSGYGITAITDAGIDYIFDKFEDFISEEDYVDGFNVFIKYTDEFVTQAKTDKPYDWGNMPKEPFAVGMNLVISVLIGLIISAIITSVWKSQLNSVKMQTAAATYMKAGSLNINFARDFFLYRNINRVAKERKSSGGSSTHRSSSGRTYGGGGRKF